MTDLPSSDRIEEAGGDTGSGVPGGVTSDHNREDNLNRRLTRLDAQIKVEYDLIGHRVGWLLTSNAFLFAAFVVALNNVNLDNASLPSIRFVYVLSFWIPIIGLASSALVTFAVFAANSVIKRLKLLRDRTEADAARQCSFEVVGIGAGSWPHRIGNGPPCLLPPLLAIVWATMLYLRIHPWLP